MDMTRFEALAAAYGGDLSRWPATERAAAQALQAQEPEAAARVLGSAACLDGALDSWRVAPASQTLRAKILGGAGSRPARAAARWFWLTGAGLAAAGVSGAICGAVLCGALSSGLQADALVAAAAPDDSSGVSAWLAGEST